MKKVFLGIAVLPLLLIAGCSSARFKDVEREIIEYGSYPQGNVHPENEAELVANLEEHAVKQDNGFYLYQDELYARIEMEDEKNGLAFDNGYVINVKPGKKQAFWFRSEPIQWEVFEEQENGNKLLVAHKLLEVQPFDSNYNESYVSSSIRAWLNGDFYNIAFADPSKIATTLVDNSAETTDDHDPEAAVDEADTNDKVFLLSYQDYVNPKYGFPKNTKYHKARTCVTTDYARLSGAKYSDNASNMYGGWYWTRSISTYYFEELGSYGAWYVYGYGSMYHYSVDAEGHCVRPAITYIG